MSQVESHSSRVQVTTSISDLRFDLSQKSLVKRLQVPIFNKFKEYITGTTY